MSLPGTRVGMQSLPLELVSSLDELAGNDDLLRLAHLLTTAASRETCSVHTKFDTFRGKNELFFKLHNIILFRWNVDTVGDS